MIGYTFAALVLVALATVDTAALVSHQIFLSGNEDVLPGDTACVRLTVRSADTSRPVAVSEFELSIDYDGDLLTIFEVRATDSLQTCVPSPVPFFIIPPGLDGCGGHRLVLRGSIDADCLDSMGIAHRPLDLSLRFRTPRDTALFNRQTALSFCWSSCDDNQVTSPDADTIYTSGTVYDPDGNDITDPHALLPGAVGMPASCTAFVRPPGTQLSRTVEFHHGRIQFADREEGRPGDVNLDGFAYEIADLELLARHCLLGDDVYAIDVGLQRESSDIDDDGLGGTVADWVAFRYWLLGLDTTVDGLRSDPRASLDIVPVAGGTELYCDADVAINAFAVWLQMSARSFDSVSFDREPVTEAYESALTEVAGGRLYAALSAGSREMPAFPAGRRRLVTVYHDGDMFPEVDSVQAATHLPQLVSIDIKTSIEEVPDRSVPDQFRLDQNYPNPFNPSTTISFNLVSGGLWQLDIFDILGRRVRSVNGSSEPGRVSVRWDGRDLHGHPTPSGIYLYRLSVKDQTRCRKMLLLR